MKKQNKGITLIALVITIIILLILAGISITSLTGSGLFEKAKLARNKTQEAQELENQMLQEYENQIDKLGGTSNGEIEEVKFTNVDTQNTQPETAMPIGTRLIKGDANKGIVIEDSKGNQWVWVEVPKTEVFKTATAINQYEAIKTDLINYVTNPTNYRLSPSSDETYEDKYYSGFGIASTDEKTENQVYEEMYNKMLNSIYTNGGFWISRYELGIKGSNTDTSLARTKCTEITDSSQEAVSQIDHIPYNFINCKGAQILSSKMSTDTTKTYSLLFGIQWDLVCKFLEVKGKWNTTTNPASYYITTDSSSWGNYEDSTLEITSRNAKQYDLSTKTWMKITEKKPSGSRILLTTGASENTNKMNIYDFAGNEYEYTLEQLTSLGAYTVRGGNYGYRDYSANGRGWNTGWDYTDGAPRATIY